ncbi:HMA2 domain-containing protein [Thioalkalivibrio sp.]|uniref:HMA2 domain-containing protein n=1 Tax=Thioalkalivibrio sp. TaxID=2093813 RepID=UPI003564EA4A
MNDTAYLVHQAPGRLRLRVPGMRGEIPFFHDMVARISPLEDIEAVRANPDTGGVLILHRRDTQQAVLDRVASVVNLTEEQYAPPSAFSRAASGLGKLDEVIARETKGGSSLSSVIFLVLVGLALAQIARGQVMAPATSLIWYALDLTRVKRTRAHGD